MAAAASNKVCKFKFESEDFMSYDSTGTHSSYIHNHGHRNKFTGYGETAQEAMDNYEKLVNEWRKRSQKEMKSAFINKKELI